MKNIIWLLLCVQQTQALASSDPCHQYENISMFRGYRSSDFYSFGTPVSLCDSQIIEDKWYRFYMDAGTRLSEKPVEPWYCGTQVPLWLNGTHPADLIPTTLQVCGSYMNNNYCGWTGPATIQKCIDTEVFYVYLLPVPPGCPLAYCVDATTKRQCNHPFIWIADEFRCGENVTKTTTAAPPTTPPVPTTTPPPGTSGWSSWGPWTLCSKLCDYGFQTRKRKCYGVSCSGPAIETQTCNTYNCKEVGEEKLQGIVLELMSTGNTILKVVEQEEDINQIIRDSVNEICLSNASICCGKPIDRTPAPGTIFVSYYDIYTSQGHPTINSDGSVNHKVIAVVNEDIDRNICQASSDRKRRQTQTKNYISYEAMAMAVNSCGDTVWMVTGLTVRSYMKPTATPEDDEDGGSSCPVLPCVVIIVVIVVAVVIIVAIVSVCMWLTAKKAKNRVNTPPPPPPYIDARAEGKPIGSPILVYPVVLDHTMMNGAYSAYPTVEEKHHYEDI